MKGFKILYSLIELNRFIDCTNTFRNCLPLRFLFSLLFPHSVQILPTQRHFVLFAANLFSSGLQLMMQRLYIKKFIDGSKKLTCMIYIHCTMYMLFHIHVFHIHVFNIYMYLHLFVFSACPAHFYNYQQHDEQLGNGCNGIEDKLTQNTIKCKIIHNFRTYETLALPFLRLSSSFSRVLWSFKPYLPLSTSNSTFLKQKEHYNEYITI